MRRLTDREAECSSAQEPAAGDVPAASPPAATGLGPAAWATTLAIALAAGFVAWGVGELTLGPETMMGSRGGPSLTQEYFAFRNGMKSFGALGAAVGIGLGLAGGLARRSVGAGVVAGLVGLVLGGVAGAAGARLLMPLYYDNVHFNSVIYPVSVHAGIAMSVGAVAGLAFALGLGGGVGRIVQCVVGGIVGGFIASISFDVIGTFFVFDQTERPISITWRTRLLARLLVALGVAAGVLLAARPHPRASRAGS